jgi:hypothetical protein
MDHGGSVLPGAAVDKAVRPQEWPRRPPAHRALTGHSRVVIVLILAVPIVGLVLGSVVAITRSTVTVPGFGTPATTR